MTTEAIPTHEFGHTGCPVTRVGLGGEGVLRTYDRTLSAREVILEAVSQGISYFDCAHVYADSERYYGTVWKEFPSIRGRIFQASKSASRDRKGALEDLDRSLKRLQTSRLDLWQIHDVRTAADLDAISGPGGALEAFVSAKESGKVRWIGVTGHHDPEVLTRAVEQWPVDAVMMPVNPVEGVLGGFLTGTLPAAKERGIGIIGMKILGASHYIIEKANITAELLIRYALSKGITVAIVGCSHAAEVRALADAGRRSETLSAAEQSRLEQAFRPYARRLAFYRGAI